MFNNVQNPDTRRLIKIYVYLHIPFCILLLGIFWKSLQFQTELNTESMNPHPFMTLITAKFNETELRNCGGTLISTKHVLTAAHCVYDALRVNIILGTSNISSTAAKEQFSSKFIIFEDYNSITYDNDIALIELEETIEINENVSLVDYASSKVDYSPGITTAVLGWALPSLPAELNDTVQVKNVNIIDNRQCTSFYGRDEEEMIDITSESKIICTMNEGEICHGDSGGPLMLEKLQIGILSSGEENCLKNTPVKYTNVAYYAKWIHQKIYQ